MVTSKIRVEMTESVVTNDPYLGDFHHRKIYEDIIISDKNQHNNAPCDVHCRFKTDYGMIIEVKIDKNYFCGISDNGWAYADFIMSRNFYEVNVQFDIESGEILTAMLREWENYDAYTNGDDEDKVYEVEAYIEY